MSIEQSQGEVSNQLDWYSYYSNMAENTILTDACRENVEREAREALYKMNATLFDTFWNNGAEVSITGKF